MPEEDKPVAMCAYVTPAERDIIDRLALAAGFVKLDGSPNRSMWVRRQIHLADEADSRENQSDHTP